ncbi:hypothetical protein ACS0TY_025787 [Phlomoides rotata]
MSLPQTADEVAILETREASPSHFLVKFESFSSLGKNGIHKYETGEFSAGGYKWRLIIYPNEGKTGIDCNYLSMYLAFSDITSQPASLEVNAVVSFFLFNQISCNYLYSLGRTCRFLPMKQVWGISKFMSKKVLMDPSNGFLIDNNCVFGAEVFIVEKSAVFECLLPKNVTIPYKRFWEISNFFKLGDVWTPDQFVVGGHKMDKPTWGRETMSLAQTADVSLVPEVAKLETREASPSHFLVKFESFSSFGKNGIHKFETGEFGAGGYKWRLIIYPNEDKTGIDSNYLSMYLAISDTTSLPASLEVNAVFSFFLFNQISCNYLYSLGRTCRFLPMKQVWGISKFMSMKLLMDPSNGFLIDNNCVFGAEVFILEKSAVFECLSPKNVTVPYKRVSLEWEISNFSKLGDVWTSEQFVVGGHKWDVSVYPKGNKSGKGCYLEVYLHLIDSKSVKVKACFSVCIKDQMNNKHDKKTVDSRWFTQSQVNWGWPSFIELNTLEDPRNGFIIKDCCHLEIELSVQEDEVV